MRLFSALSVVTAVMLLGLVGLGQRTTSQRGQSPMRGFGIIHAPDFPSGAQWFNTDRPISLKALRGKFVLLDFWTYC